LNNTQNQKPTNRARRLGVTLLLALASETANKILPLVVLYHVQRTLGVAAFGAAQFSISLYEILIPLVALGFANFGAIAIGRADTTSDSVRRTIGSIITLRLILAAVASSVILTLVSDGGIYHDYRSFAVGSIFILFTTAIDCDHVFVARQKLAPLAVAMIGIKITTAVITILAVDSAQDAVTYTMLYFASNGLVSLLGFVAATTRIGITLPNRDDLLTTVRGSLPFTLTMVLIMSADRIDMLLAEALKGQAGAGLYAGPLRLVGGIINVTGSIGRVFFSEMLASLPLDKLRKLIGHEIFLFSALLLPIAAGVWFVAPELLNAFYGPDFVAMAPVLGIMTLGALVHATTLIAGFQILMLRGRAVVFNWTLLGSFILAGALSTVMSTQFGLVGVAGGFFLGKAIGVLILVHRASRLVSGIPFENAAKPALATLGMVVVLSLWMMFGGDPGALENTGDSTIDSWLVTLGLGIATYTTILLMLSRRNIREAIAAVRRDA